MALYFTELSITSDTTPECASRTISRGRVAWRLSWLPDRTLTFEQARAGMELDELLSQPGSAHDGPALALANEYAGKLGMLREHVVILLAKRMAARLQCAVSTR
ncbi:hypothetical protein [Nocardia brasiliensis]|uniref:hypothetical protein n=1 Tax=Nocardia brasiliensis TaxID=37326 RepID=UPI0036716D53